MRGKHARPPFYRRSRRRRTETPLKPRIEWASSSKPKRQWTNSRLLSRKWRLCLVVCGMAIALDATGRPLPFEYATTISGVATTLIGMQTWLDSRIPTSGHWTPHKTLSRKWWTGTLLILGLFGAAGVGVLLESSTLTLVGTVMGAWLGGQTFLDFKAQSERS